MKLFSKTLLLFVAAGFFVIGCDKKESLPFYTTGTTPALTLSSMDIAPAPSDSDNAALTANWSNPAYASDSASVKYVVQIDSAGRNFSKAASKTVSGALTATFTARELNTIALGYGFAFNTAYSMDVRLVSSYGNNNDQKISNVITFKYTPYKIPPKVALPTSGELYLVGDATAGGWTNPVPTPSQKFAQINETTWAGVFQLTGGKQYLVLPVNGDWGHKFAVADNSVAGLSAGGDFGFDQAANFPAPAISGLYTITLDFQSGTFIVTPYTAGILPDSLYMVGDATAGGWSNPVPAPAQQFTRLNSAQFELTINLTGGKAYLLLPVNGSWDHKFAVDDASTTAEMMAGTFRYDAPTNFPAPATDGTYKVDVNFIDNSYMLTKQ